VFSSAVLAVTSFVVALQIANSVNHATARGMAVTSVVAVSALIVPGGLGYAFTHPFTDEDELADDSGTTTTTPSYTNPFDEASPSPSEIPGPQSPMVKGLRLPSGSTLSSTKSPSGDGGDRMETWDVPLSYEDAEHYVNTEWDFDSISGLDRQYSGDQQGVDEDGAGFRTWFWGSDTAPARAIWVRLYDTNDPTSSLIFIGDFTD
jgi:hypothetical protein